MSTEEMVIEALRNSAVSLTAGEVSERAGISLPAALKCLENLEAKGLAERRERAGVTLYTVKGRRSGVI
ncbi:MAG: MarR family transcriptional regulator [Candidatus Aenigmarchaeota archaeon]|nr:MarR family transcriptional regulator [Candidatus Aenigmarchaeota archaeon]